MLYSDVACQPCCLGFFQNLFPLLNHGNIFILMLRQSENLNPTILLFPCSKLMWNHSCRPLVFCIYPYELRVLKNLESNDILRCERLIEFRRFFFSACFIKSKNVFKLQFFKVMLSLCILRPWILFYKSLKVNL